ncbi:MFS transporter [Antrihabitans sp. YC3-6]|uniref:MFS transporter n=1 Tax=Antrihabitans stalagmiti TaxID=2799499 RepID=A0A934NMU8_9NOCA|nr:MFS transporter [Antrihabitans stalagmiti]MBJ8338065.1 MFS transporter [Antrihabitans stalagmiti]
MTAIMRAETGEGYLPGTADYRRVMASLFVAGVATFALLYSTQAILPTLSAEFGVSSTAATLTVSLTTLGLGVALLITGPLSDIVGRTRLIQLSLTASALIGTAGALAPNWSTLLTLRLVEGVALAGLPAVATAYLREELHPSTHARAAGLYIGGTAFGGMVGRLLTGSVADVAGWRWALAATGILAVVCALVVRALLPQSRRFVSTGSGTRTALRSTLRAASDPALVLLYLIGCASSGALVAVFNVLGFRLSGAPFDLGPSAASLVFLVYPLGSLSAMLFGRIADSIGRHAVLPLGVALAVAGILVTGPATLPAIVVGLGLLTAGFFAVHGIASGWVPARAHAAGIPTGQAASLYLFMYYLGSSVFGSLGGNAWSADGWPGVMMLSLALFLVTALCALAMRKRRT